MVRVKLGWELPPKTTMFLTMVNRREEIRGWDVGLLVIEFAASKSSSEDQTLIIQSEAYSVRPGNADTIKNDCVWL